MLATTRDQVTSFWSRQTKPQRVTFFALLLALLILVPVLIVWASKPSYSVAYNGLSEADAAQIVQKLDESKTPYTLKDTGTILVPSDQVYQVRLKMARDGLPKSSTVGYELFDGSMLGMTEFLQRVNYQRALEGELERTISSLSSVEAVRVHIVTPEKTLLTDDQQPATASVTIQVKQGETLSPTQVRSITHLVASSVESLKPEDVVVIDTNGALLTGVAGSELDNVANQSDDQRAAETAAAAEVKKRVQSMLDKVLGPNRYVAQASVRMDWNQKEVVSSVYDPTPAAVRSEHTVDESYNNAGAALGGVPGAGSNLPTPIPGVTSTATSGYYQRSEKTYNYEITQTETKEKVTPGQVKQVSVSIMVDKITDANQLASIKSAAAAAAGIDEARGDQIVVESVDFDQTFYEEQATNLEKQQQQNQYMQIGLGVAAAILLAAVMIYFQRSIKQLRKRTAEEWRPVMKPVSELAMQQAGALYSGADLDMLSMAATQNQVQHPGKSDEQLLAEINSRTVNQTFPEDEQKARIIQRLTEESPATVAEIIQIWLNEDERKNA